MTTIKATWWSVTAYNDEIKILEDAMKGDVEIPVFVKEIHGGVEECPDTHRRHFQGALHTDSIRMSQIKKWLPTAHLEKAKNPNALIKYALKDETSVGEKSSTVVSTYTSPEVLLKQLIVFRYENMTKEEPSRCESKQSYHKLVNYFVECDYKNRKKFMSVLADPRTYRIYEMFCRTIYKCYIDELRELDFENVV